MGKQKTDNSPDLGELLQQVLSEQLSSMDAVPIPAEVPAFKEMYFDHTEPDNSRWKEHCKGCPAWEMGYRWRFTKRFGG